MKYSGDSKVTQKHSLEYSKTQIKLSKMDRKAQIDLAKMKN
ncbi:hypothetical protein [Candidatus Liberibacter brunswickensis]